MFTALSHNFITYRGTLQLSRSIMGGQLGRVSRSRLVVQFFSHDTAHVAADIIFRSIANAISRPRASSLDRVRSLAD